MGIFFCDRCLLLLCQVIFLDLINHLSNSDTHLRDFSKTSVLDLQQDAHGVHPPAQKHAHKAIPEYCHVGNSLWFLQDSLCMVGWIVIHFNITVEWVSRTYLFCLFL